MSQENPSGEPLVGEVRVRVPLPVIIPVGALILIGLVAVGFSRVLLALPKEAATIIAIAMAANVLGVCAFVALRRRVSGASMLELGAILIYPVVIGIAIAALNIGEETHATGGETEQNGGGGGGEGTGGAITVTALNIAFDVSEIAVPADEEASVDFVNEDSVEHNISVYMDQADGLKKENAHFTGEIITGPGASVTYAIPAIEAGEYYFQCDIHPNMNGAYIAE